MSWLFALSVYMQWKQTNTYTLYKKRIRIKKKQTNKQRKNTPSKQQKIDTRNIQMTIHFSGFLQTFQ